MRENSLLYVALRIAARLLPLIPLSVAYWLADVSGFLAYYLVAPARRGIISNLSVATGEAPSSPRLRLLARRAFQSDAKNWVDTLRIARVTRDEVERSVRVEGWERLDAALSHGRGVIIVTLHLGNFDLVGQVLAGRGYRLTVPVEAMKPDRLFRFLTELRTSKGITIVTTERAPRVMLRALGQGELIGVAGDRGPQRGTVPVTLCGRAAQLPRAAAALARRTGAPVVLGVGVRVGRGAYQGYIRGPLPMLRTGDEERDERRNVQTIADAMAEFIRAYPDQWLAFSPIWRTGNLLEPADTIERPEEAGV